MVSSAIFSLPLTEIIRRSFGEQINFDDDSDPVVKRLRFLQKSPSAWHASLHDSARNLGNSRSYVLGLFRLSDQLTDPNHPHVRWLERIRYDKDTYEILGEFPSEEIQQVGAETHDSLRGALDTPESAPRPNNVLRFPTATPSGIETQPNIGA